MTTSIRVLLAEDDELCAKLAMRLLCELAELATDRILLAKDGQEALDYLYRRGAYSDHAPQQPDLVLLDLKMPRLDGFDVLRQAKTDPLLRGIPIVVLSASEQEQDLKQAYELGANGYIVKAMDFNEFKITFDAVCRYWLKANIPFPKNDR